MFDTGQPLPQTHGLVLGTHAHANWSFSAEGVYRLRFTVIATSVTGQPLSDTETYTFAVGDVDPTIVEPGEGTEPPTTTTTTTTTTTGGEPTTTTTDPAGDCVVLDDGHVDAIAPRALDGRLTTQVKDGTRGPEHVVWREPNAVVTHLVPESRNTIPNNPVYAFLGTAGNPVWLIPQTQIPGIVWAGWNTESLTADMVTGDVTVRLAEVDGPGNVAVFLTGLAPTVVFNAADGLPDTLHVALGTHAHANWGFTAEGVYRLTVAMTATLASGETQTDTDIYTFAVGNVDPATALGGHCTGGGGPTGTTTTAPVATPNNPGDRPGPQGATRPLAYTGTGGLAYLVSLGALLLGGGAALLVLYRRRTKNRHNHWFASKGDPVRFRTALLLPGLVTAALAAGVLPGAETTVPDDPAYGFLGSPCAPVWILPQAQVFWLDIVLYVLVALAVVISVQTIGNILVLALLITPAATARFAHRPSRRHDDPRPRHRRVLRARWALRLLVMGLPGRRYHRAIPHRRVPGRVGREPSPRTPGALPPPGGPYRRTSQIIGADIFVMIIVLKSRFRSSDLLTAGSISCRGMVTPVRLEIVILSRIQPSEVDPCPWTFPPPCSTALSAARWTTPSSSPASATRCPTPGR